MAKHNHSCPAFGRWEKITSAISSILARLISIERLLYDIFGETEF